MIALAASEEVIDASGAAPRIGALLPSGARPRQLSARPLLLGMMITLADGRPAHLTVERRSGFRWKWVLAALGMPTGCGGAGCGGGCSLAAAPGRRRCCWG